MKVIFFDIDGVLNCESTPNPRDFPYVADKRLLRRFKELLRRSRAKAVMSSSWRVDPVGREAARLFGIPFIDVCPDRPNSPRRREVELWLKRHPDVTRYAVIDDEDDGLDELPLFQTSSKDGLTTKVARGVERYLSGETDEDMRAGPIARAAENIKSLFKRSKS